MWMYILFHHGVASEFEVLEGNDLAEEIEELVLRYMFFVADLIPLHPDLIENLPKGIRLPDLHQLDDRLIHEFA